MTRLKENDIQDITAGLENYDKILVRKTGRTLRGIACHALDAPEEALDSITASSKIAVVPFRCGEGVITGFSETLRGIVRHLGFDCFVTHHTDASGIAEAVENQAHILLMADDHRYFALDVQKGTVADNSEATGTGFTAALDLMVNGLKGRKVLVVGCGPVGRSAAYAAVKKGARLAILDLKPQRCQSLAAVLSKTGNEPITIMNSLESAMHHYHLVIDATNAAAVFSSKCITPHTYISAPGMPLGLTPGAAGKIRDRLYHDPLQTGTAVMLLQALQPNMESLRLSHAISTDNLTPTGPSPKP